jgi:hypothetical protein
MTYDDNLFTLELKYKDNPEIVDLIRQYKKLCDDNIRLEDRLDNWDCNCDVEDEYKYCHKDGSMYARYIGDID